ncbi:MAG: glutamate racemase [Nitriliruptor sp.]|nr:MAG: glutamate racemase [Nitriliruptor sp.]TVR18323.1 MAG: glutamate racemase [Nitriliruptor sp.]
MRERPIGVFDSGLGGLTVLHAMVDLLPAEDLLYLGDTARYPYGERDLADLQRISLAVAEELVDRGIKLLVVACNSATAAALPELREALDVPVVGVVDPGVRAAAATSRTRRAVVIGTRATVASGVYEDAADRLDLGLVVRTVPCPGLVELVEEGRTSGPEVTAIVRDRLAPLLSARIDTLVLGCTHFPMLARPISEVVGRDVTLVSSADETAFEVRDLLERLGWLREEEEAAGGRRHYLTTGDPDTFAALGERFLGAPLGSVERVTLAALEPRTPVDPTRRRGSRRAGRRQAEESRWSSAAT